ncbi:MAG: hypothetical protein U0I25_01540, partial [Oscillospiraceae bacterium]|nr:hypothetical protein [Oscillospiraceae bacterium]
MKVEMIYLSQEDVIRCGGMSLDKAIDDLEEVFRLYDKGDYILPGKIVMKRPEPNAEETTGRINAMPGYIGGRFNMPGIKWIGSGPQNPFKYGLPRGSAVIVLNDPETKVPIAIMDGTLISTIRTGAVTGVCAKYMAPSRSKTVGLFGAGPQCKTQLMALKASLPQLEKAYVYDLSRESGKICGGDVAKAEHGRAGGERPPRRDRKRRHPCDRDDRDRADHPRRGDQKGRLR